MKNSRPEVDDPHLFIRCRTPFHPFVESNVFYQVINKYMAQAGIQVKNRKQGPHSMRHGAASNFFQNNTPYPVITGILGHENTSTTKLYLRIDIQQLRTIALEVPKLLRIISTSFHQNFVYMIACDFQSLLSCAHSKDRKRSPHSLTKKNPLRDFQLARNLI